MAMPGDEGNPIKPQLPNLCPSVLISSDKGDQPHKMTLRDRSHNVWILKVEKEGDLWYFTDGWSEFARENKITGGDLLVYESPGEGLIDFKILRSSGSEEEGEYRNRIGRGDAADDGDDKKPITGEDKKKKEAGGGKVVKKRRNRNKDFYGTEVFRSGEIQQPVNPYFVANANRCRENELYIPVEVVRCYSLKLPDTLMIEDSTGRRFTATRRRWKDGRILFYGGWKSVCRVNTVSKKDRIVCEFVPGESGDLELHVTFVHATAE